MNPISGSALSALHARLIDSIWSRRPCGQSSHVVHTASTPSRLAWFMAVRTSWYALPLKASPGRSSRDSSATCMTVHPSSRAAPATGSWTEHRAGVSPERDAKSANSSMVAEICEEGHTGSVTVRAVPPPGR